MDWRKVKEAFPDGVGPEVPKGRGCPANRMQAWGPGGKVGRVRRTGHVNKGQ